MEPFARLPKRVLQDDQLPDKAKSLFAALDAMLDKKTGRCAPTIGRLAAWIGCSDRYAKQLIVVLEMAGYIRVERSSGRRNSYQLLPSPSEFTGEPQFPGSEQFTGEPQFPGTGEPQFPALVASDRTYVLRTREKEQEAAIPSPKAEVTQSKPEPHLFASQHRHWLRTALEYLLGERSELADLRDWFPAIVAEFFLAHSWQRSSDPETAVLWAKRFAAIEATETEVAAAFDWALSSPAVDGQGRKIFGRPDHLDRITFRIKSQRKRQAAWPEPTNSPAAKDPALVKAMDDWQRAIEEEREQARRRVRRRRPNAIDGAFFAVECAYELQRMREEQAFAPDVGATAAHHDATI